MDISKFSPFNKVGNPFQRIHYFRLAEKYPRFNFMLSLLSATFGIVLLLLFPWLLFTRPSELYDTVIHANELKDWIDAGIELVLIILGGGFSWALYKIKFAVPTGLDITEEKFPHLHKIITELREEFGNPKIDRIILRDDFEIRVVKTPRSGMPFLSTSTLIIGLPVLLTMSPLYFRALLARRIGQLSTRHTPFTTRLYFLNDIWLQFKNSTRQSKNKFIVLLNTFFRLYSPFYQSVLMPLLQKEELEADRYGMDLVNHSDMVECIVYEEVVARFLKNKYWPKIYHMAKRSKTPEFLPYSQMTKVVKAGITDEEISQSVQAALKVEHNVTESMPTLSVRLNHLGHAKPLPPKRLSKTAAEFLLGNMQGKIIEMFDKRWLKKISHK